MRLAYLCRRAFATAITGLVAIGCGSSGPLSPEAGADHPVAESRIEASMETGVDTGADTRDAGTESSPETGDCIGSAKVACWMVSAMWGATFFVCNDVPQPPVCAAGTWQCPPFHVETS